MECEAVGLCHAKGVMALPPGQKAYSTKRNEEASVRSGETSTDYKWTPVIKMRSINQRMDTSDRIRTF